MTLSTLLTGPLEHSQPAGAAAASQPFPYSFGPANAGPTTLDEYLDVRMWANCLLHHTADWERPAPPALTLANFYNYVPRRRNPCSQLYGLAGISRALGYRLVEFSLRCIEAGVSAWAKSTGCEPTPEEIVAAIPDYGQLQEGSDDPAWMVARAFTNQIVAAALTNALHSRWGFPRNPRAAPRTLPDARQAPPDPRRHAYSFAAPGSAQPMDLHTYLRGRAQDCPALLGRAGWEWDLDDMPDRFTYCDFWNMAGGRPTSANLRHASLALCYRMVWCGLEQLEAYAAGLAERRQAEPTPGEIMARLHDIARRWQPKRHGDDLVMYAKTTAYPILGTALTNALHSRWGYPRNPRALVPAGAAPVSARLLMKALLPRPQHAHPRPSRKLRAP